MIIEEETVAGLELLEYMSDLKNVNDAREVFMLFCAKYAHRLLK